MEVIKPFIPRGYSWEFLVGVCRLVLQILTLFQTKKMSFSRSHPFSDLAFRQTLCHNYLDQSANKNFFKCIRSRIFLFLSYSFGNETINKFIHSRSSLKTIPDSRQKWAKLCPFSDQKGPKTTPFGAAHTYMAYIREYPPGFYS